MSLSQLKEQSMQYFYTHLQNGGSSEFDMSINDISRNTIEAFKKERGACFLGKINRYSNDKKKPFLVEYTGQKVYNFEYDFCIPSYDQEIIDMINLLNNKELREGICKSIHEAINDVFYRIDKLSGVNLSWV